MRTAKYKQVLAICENNADDFQDKMNNALARIADPEIIFDNNRSFTAYVIYKVRKDIPEDVLEFLEMMDDTGSHTCQECPHFRLEKNKKKWGSCLLKVEKTRSDSRACENFYMWRIKKLEEAKREFEKIPYRIEG